MACAAPSSKVETILIGTLTHVCGDAKQIRVMSIVLLVIWRGKYTLFLNHFYVCVTNLLPNRFEQDN